MLRYSVPMKIFLILMACMGSFIFAQTVAPVSSPEALSAQKAARELSGAVKMGDMAWMAEKMYPPIKKTLALNTPGGMKAVDESYRKMGEVMKKKGVVIETFEVGAPFGEYIVHEGITRIVILPTKLIISMKSPGGPVVRVEQSSCIFAVRREKNFGEKPGDPHVEIKSEWFFIEGSTSLNTLRNHFKDLPVNIAMPLMVQRMLPPH